MPTLAVGARKPTDAARLVLHGGGQQAIYRSPVRFRVVVAGRRWGKTQLARTELITRALNGPGRFWYVAPTLKDAKDIFWADLKDGIDPSWLAGSPNESELRVDLRTGAEIRLFGAEDPNSLRGRGLRFVVLDEFADMKVQAWTESLRPALSDYKAPALFIGTPRSYNHFHDLYERGQNPQRPTWASWQYKTIENPFIDPQEIEDAKHDLDPRTFRQEYEASFETLAGRAYYAFTRAHNVGPVLFQPLAPVYLFFDFNINPATAGIGQRVGNCPYVYREVKIRHAGGEATRAAARRVQELLREAHHSGPIRIYGDATGKSAKTTGPADHAVLRELFPSATWCIPGHNPHEKDRVSAVNACCESMSGDHRLLIDPVNVGLIADLEQVIFAENGELDKKSNPELTHLSDGLGYWLVRDFPPVIKTRAGAMDVPWIN
jgi:Terminase large subunit, T4likevirus-type, N-terminal